MDRDKEAIGKSIKLIEDYVDQIRMEAIGWAFSTACDLLDNGQDPRKFEIPNLIERAKNELDF